MNEIRFNCPHCHQRLCVSTSVVGRTISCPSCSGHIRLYDPKKAPASGAQPPPQQEDAAATPPPAARDIKFECPKCHLHLVIDARGAGLQITCQHCGARITAPAMTATTIPVPTPSATSLTNSQRVPDLIGRLYRGDAQAGEALFAIGPSILSALVESLREEAIEEPNLSKGADEATDLLVRLGKPCVPMLLSRLGKSRHAYLALGRIGTEPAIAGLARELSSCNWRRAELACKGLGLAEQPHVLKVFGQIEALRTSTRSGEVYLAAGNTIAALQNRFRDKFGPTAAAPGNPKRTN